jgi:hypothetical protein
MILREDRAGSCVNYFLLLPSVSRRNSCHVVSLLNPNQTEKLGYQPIWPPDRDRGAFPGILLCVPLGCVIDFKGIQISSKVKKEWST